MNLVDALTCAALANGWPMDPELGSESIQEPACIVADLDLAGRLDATLPDPGIQTGATLQRARAELGLVTWHNVSGRVAIDARRSAPETGYLGLDGETWFARIQIAEARYTLPKAGLSVSAGLIDDPWVVSGNQAWGYRPLAPIMAEGQRWSDRSDLGGAVTWTGPDRLVRVTASLLTGEGLARRERNNGKDVHGLVEVRPLGQRDLLVLALYGKDGSRGTAQARNHRLGGRVHSTLPLGDDPDDFAVAGASVMKTWGVDGDADRTPWGGHAWGTLDASLLTGAVRVGLIDQVPGTEQTTDASLLLAVGVRPWTSGPSLQRRPAHLLLGVDQTWLGAASAPIAGGDGTRRRTLAFVQLGINLRAVDDFGDGPDDD